MLNFALPKGCTNLGLWAFLLVKHNKPLELFFIARYR